MKNYVQEANTLTIAVSHPASPTSGSPVRIGGFCGVAVADKQADGNTTVKIAGVVSVSVKGVDGAGNAAVAVGDKLYYVDADTPPVSKKNTGTFFGYALGSVSSGATETVKVLIAN